MNRRNRHSSCVEQRLLRVPQARTRISGVLPLFTVVIGVSSCGNPRAVSVPSMSFNAADRVAAAESIPVTVDFSVTSIPDAVKPLLGDSRVLSFLDPTLISGYTSSAAYVIPVTAGNADLPKQIPTPVFAEKKTFLALNSDGSDFWMIDSSGAGIRVTRPINPIAAPLPTQLSEAMSVLISADAAPLGFGRDFLILKTKASLWIVQRSSSMLKAGEIPFPDSEIAPIAAGQLSGSDDSFWLAGSKTIWRLSPAGQDWKADKFKMDFKKSDRNFQTIAGVFGVVENKVKLMGPALMISGSNVSLSSLKFPALPAATIDSAPAKTLLPMSFEEASKRCVLCHGSQSNDAMAKGKLSGSENLSVWVSKKTQISESVKNGFMPQGEKLSDEDRQKLLMFVENLK